MSDGDELDGRLARWVAVRLWIAAPIAYCAALLYFPEYWAIATGAIFVIASGLFTTKVLLAIESPWGFCLVPVFGAGWLLFLWLMFRVVG